MNICENCGLWVNCKDFEHVWENNKVCSNWIGINYNKYILTKPNEYSKIMIY